MIKGKCKTNLDNYKHLKWPEEFVVVPMLGDTVQAETKECLKVVGITHVMEENKYRDVDSKRDEKIKYPLIIVELSKHLI
mgnify:CR=1 FL=1